MAACFHIMVSAFLQRELRSSQTPYGPQNLHSCLRWTDLLLGIGVHTCNPSTWKAEAGGSGVQVQPELHS
jgi:hypothetical protein